MGWLVDTLTSPLLRQPLIQAALAGALGGLVGVHVVLRRLSFFTMALTHATFPGVVLAELAGVSLLFGSAAFGLVVVLAIVALGGVKALDSSTAVGVVLAGGFALGVVLLSAQPGFTRDLTAYLVGSVLTVGVTDIVITAIGAAAVLAVLVVVHKELVLGAFDRPAAEALGFRPARLDLLVLVLVEVAIVLLIPTVGTILAVALIVAPAATARLWTDRVGTAMVMAPFVGAASGVIGIAVSRSWRIAGGPAIVLVGVALFVASLALAPSGPLRRWRHGARALRSAPRGERYAGEPTTGDGRQPVPSTIGPG